MRRTLILAALALAISTSLGLVLSTPAVADVPHVNTDGGIAIHGHDPVAYHVAGAAVEGRDDITASYDGATWHFASAENRDLFRADPARYAPAYGGYCAYGLSSGYKVDIDPDAWSVRDGTLSLYYTKPTQDLWLEKPAEYIEQADAAWPGLRDATEIHE